MDSILRPISKSSIIITYINPLVPIITTYIFPLTTIITTCINPLIATTTKSYSLIFMKIFLSTGGEETDKTNNLQRPTGLYEK